MSEIRKHLRVKSVQEALGAVEGVIIEIAEEETVSVPQAVPILQPIPIPLSDEERVAKKTVDALRKYMPEVFNLQTPPRAQIQYPSYPNRIFLSMEEYREAGSPTVGDYVKLLLKKEARSEWHE